MRENEYIEKRINEQRIRLYIIIGVDEQTEFITQTRKEIGVTLAKQGYKVPQTCEHTWLQRKQQRCQQNVYQHRKLQVLYGQSFSRQLEEVDCEI